MPPETIAIDRADARLDRGRSTFVLVIPAGFERRGLAGKGGGPRLKVDATRMGRAFTGSGYIRQIALGEVDAFLRGVRMEAPEPAGLAARAGPAGHRDRAVRRRAGALRQGHAPGLKTISARARPG
jgi:ABC-2 type transport system permease protein